MKEAPHPDQITTFLRFFLFTSSCPEKAVPPEDQVSETAMEWGAATSLSPLNVTVDKIPDWLAVVVTVLRFLYRCLKKAKTCRSKARAKNVERATTGAADVKVQIELQQKSCAPLSLIRNEARAGDSEVADTGAADVKVQIELQQKSRAPLSLIRNEARAGDSEVADTGAADVKVQIELRQKSRAPLSLIRNEARAGDSEVADTGAADVDAKDELL